MEGKLLGCDEGVNDMLGTTEAAKLLGCDDGENAELLSQSHIGTLKE
jgi:hypothetical protein